MGTPSTTITLSKPSSNSTRYLSGKKMRGSKLRMQKGSTWLQCLKNQARRRYRCVKRR
jgi:hypothetical protein